MKEVPYGGLDETDNNLYNPFVTVETVDITPPLNSTP